ncbi:MAG TPA: hypothetical protein VLB44_13815 [Kofleriaceae bacterium]|nr:hypothetical protein [Kofleriaceae bacterium]
MAAAGVAHAGGQSGTIGVGAEAQINGIGGASLNFDAGEFHVGGFLGFHDPGGRNDDVLEIGGRFFYHVHSTAMSDFGLGGTLGIASQNRPAPADRETLLYLEPGFQIRLFLASNVALSFSTGVTIGVMDADNVDFGGQLVGGSGAGVFTAGGAIFAFSGGAGVHYYFF